MNLEFLKNRSLTQKNKKYVTQGAAGRAALQNMGGSGQETEENNWRQNFQKHKAIEFRGVRNLISKFSYLYYT